MKRAYVGLGANIGQPRRQLQTALRELGELPQTRVTANSGFYRSTPLGHVDQPEFLNAVAALDTGLEPEDLLDRLFGIESLHGRTRSYPNAPRTLDLDLLLYGDASICRANLTVPHPRMHERAFVLKPLVEIAPDIAVPGKGRARDLLAACTEQLAERID